MTRIHDTARCDCEMCQFAQNASQANSGLFGVEQGEKIDSSPPSASGIAISAPDFEHEWTTAPAARTRYTEQAEAEHWFQRGLWLGIQYERERGLLAMNGDLREMQRLARERVER